MDMIKPINGQGAKPFVKWAGGKAQILSRIRTKYPAGLGGRINKYAEPFIGGGAVLFDILKHYILEEIYISDVNRELIYTYSLIRDDVAVLADALRSLENEYISSCAETRKEIYYTNRRRFNELKMSRNDVPELAALFIFLNRTCFNGLYRVNAKGEYNVPQGSYKNPSICDVENLFAVSERLRNVTIVCDDYKSASGFIDDRTFAYFDPPYRPLSSAANFTAYAQDGFDDAAQIELARFIDEMSERGAWVVASNSDPTNADADDDFLDRLYARHTVLRIEAGRAINSAGNGRGRIRELLIANS
jgi:DNA adenine methylase